VRILFLSAWFPYPHDNGSKLRIFNLIRGLAQAHEVTLFAFTERPEDPVPQPLLDLCREVVPVASRPYRANSGRAVLGLLSRRPRVLVDRHAPEMEALIRKAAGAGGYDLIIASQWYMAAYLETIPGVAAIFEEVEIGVFQDHIQRAENPLLRFRHGLTSLKLQSYLRKLLRRFGASTVASVGERELLRRMVPSYEPVAVIPNGISLADSQGVSLPVQPDQLVFAGGFTYHVNYEAMCWFTGEALPLIHAQRPDVRLTITGDNRGLPLPYTRNVDLPGLVPDIRPVVASAAASIAPLQTGGGTRLKILEAMAIGTPVIATSKGAEGLDVVSGEHLLIADSKEDFAAATLRLLSDPELRERLSRNARDLVRRIYDWPVILPLFLELVELVAAGRPVDSLVRSLPGGGYTPTSSRPSRTDIDIQDPCRPASASGKLTDA
jgi:glycosyltransferase involved in cell wall biosynthesis